MRPLSAMVHGCSWLTMVANGLFNCHPCRPMNGFGLLDNCYAKLIIGPKISGPHLWNIWKHNRTSPPRRQKTWNGTCPRPRSHARGGPWPVWENRGGLSTQIHFHMCSYHAKLFSKMCMSFIFCYDDAFVRIFFANVRLFFCYLYGLELVATIFRPDKS